MERHSSDWKDRFTAIVRQESIAGIVDVLDLQATSHAGTASSTVKRHAIRMLRKHYKARTEDLYCLAKSLCNIDNATAQEVGAILLADLYTDHENEVSTILHRLADCKNWEVREWVASACGNILAAHFHEFYDEMVRWSRDSSEFVRRAVVLAVMYAGKRRDPNFISPMLDLLEPLLLDRSKYVRDNLGPFAIGSALIKYYPEEVLMRISSWVQSDEEQIRWNIAMVFSAAEGAKYAARAKSIIHILVADNRPYVQRAVARAMKSIETRCPEFFVECQLPLIKHSGSFDVGRVKG